MCGAVQVDDASLGGEREGGKAGRGSENKAPFVAAVSLDAEGRPRYVKMAPVSGFTRNAIRDRAKAGLSPGRRVMSGCRHHPIVAGGRKPKELPEFRWVHTVLGNVKTSFGGAYHAFGFAQYGSRSLAAFAYRCNRRFQLETLPLRLLVAAATIAPRPATWLRSAEAAC